jgi:hypothetical protein
VTAEIEAGTGSFVVWSGGVVGIFVGVALRDGEPRAARKAVRRT